MKILKNMFTSEEYMQTGIYKGTESRPSPHTTRTWKWVTGSRSVQLWFRSLHFYSSSGQIWVGSNTRGELNNSGWKLESQRGLFLVLFFCLGIGRAKNGFLEPGGNQLVVYNILRFLSRFLIENMKSLTAETALRRPRRFCLEIRPFLGDNRSPQMMLIFRT